MPPAEREVESCRDNVLGMSLSSKFFDNLKLSGDAKGSKGVVKKGAGSNNITAAAAVSYGAGTPASKVDDVAALKARLRSMGVLGATSKSADCDATSPPLDIAPSRRGSSGEGLGMQFESELDTCTTTSSGESERQRRSILRGVYLEQEEELRVKAAHCKEVVR